MLVLSRKKDEKIIIDDDIEITVVELDNGQVQLGIDAPQEVEIHREEVYRRIKAENIAASKKGLDLGKLRDFGLEDGE